MSIGFNRAAAPALINLGSIGISFLARLFLARAIGPVAFGIFSVWFNNVQMFGLAGMFGQQNHALRHLAEHQEKGPAATNAALHVLRFCTLSGLAAAILSAAFFLLLQDGSPQEAAMQAIAVLIFTLLTILSAIHRSFGSFVIGVLFDRALPQAGFLLVVLLAVLAGLELGNATGAFTATLAAGLIPSLGYMLRRLSLRVRDFFGAVPWRAQVSAALPFFLLSIGLVVNGRYLLGVAGIYYGGEELGAIGLLLTVAAVILIPGTTFNLVFGPQIARALSSGAGTTTHKTVGVYLGAVVLTSLAAGGVIAAGFDTLAPRLGFAIDLPPGSAELAAGTTVLAAFSAAILFVQQMAGHARAASSAVLGTVAIKIAAGLWVAPRFGFDGLLWLDLSLGIALLAYLAEAMRRMARGWPRR